MHYAEWTVVIDEYGPKPYLHYRLMDEDGDCWDDACSLDKMIWVIRNLIFDVEGDLSEYDKDGLRVLRDSLVAGQEMDVGGAWDNVGLQQ